MSSGLPPASQPALAERVSAHDFDRDGFCLVPDVVEPDLVARARARIDAVVAGDYDTGNPPWYRNLDPTSAPADRLVKIDQPHLADRTLLELVSHRGIGACAAAVSESTQVQIWAVQLLVKPPAVADQGNVGWHQDMLYWGDYWDEGVFTAWVAMSDVTPDAGPLQFIRGSHRWGFEKAGDFLSQDLTLLREQYTVPDGESWQEVQAVLPPGGVSFHHRLTVHGSGRNVSAGPRCSLAVHLCNERATWKSDAARLFGFDLDDTERFPVIFRR